MNNTTSLHHNLCSSTIISERFETYKIFIEVYLVLFLCLAGITGNALSILVLGRDKTMRRTTAYLLQMVAVADTLYLTMCIFFQTVNTIQKHTVWIVSLNRIWPYFEPYIWPCASIAQTCTVWLVLVLTADRYIAICKPLHAPQYSTTPRMRKVVMGIYIFSVIYNIPRFFERTVKTRIDIFTNSTFVCVGKTAMRENEIYFLFYKTFIFFIVRFLFPLSLLAFFNTKLIQAIQHSKKLSKSQCSSKYGLTSIGRRPSGVRRRDRQQHTRILVVVVLVFILCGMPDFFCRVCYTIMIYVPYLKSTYIWELRYVNIFSNLCLAVNSCTNFVIYCLLGRKFRIILLDMLCQKKNKQCIHRKVVVMKSTSKSVTPNGTAIHASYALFANGSSSPEHLYA